MKARIKPTHLERRAYVYIRQSTPRQVLEHKESTERQYALVERAKALGWPDSAIEVIDEDLGRSGATAEGRTGFMRLAKGVARGEAGAIFAIEVSRLTRSSQDWQRLLSLCAVAEVLAVDEHTVYDPGDKDDKLLLDLKGMLSEAELHWLGLRLNGARLSKAKRGELPLRPPTGYVWGEQGYELDPDESVQRAVRLVFERFAVEPSAWAVVRWAHKTGFLFPSRCQWANGTSELAWKALGVSRLWSVLANPVYAGVYAYGRHLEKKVLVDGEIRRVQQTIHEPEDWLVANRDAHPGYITWEQYMANRQKLKQNNTRGGPAVQGAPREGPALLSGIVICGRCGRRMRPNYGSHPWWVYMCVGGRDRGESLCWSVPGKSIDAAAEELLLDTVVPSELDLCLAVENEADKQAKSLAEQWKLRIEQACYEARLAERRYKAVDPDNRVVARTLERQWELRLQELEEVTRQYEEAKRQRHVELTEQDRKRIRALARDLRVVWNSPTTEPADKKAMLRLVIEAISLTPVDVPYRETRVRVQWHGGAVTELTIPRPSRGDGSKTPEHAIERTRQLAGDGLHDEMIAARLNDERVVTGMDKEWNVWAVRWVRQRYGIERTAVDLPRRHPLPKRHPDGRYSVDGAAKRFGVTKNVVRWWIKQGTVSACQEDFQQHRNVWWLNIDDSKAAELEKAAAGANLGLQGLINIRRNPLPNRHPDGRYSVPGAASHFGVSNAVIHRWIKQGLVSATQEDYEKYRGAWWVEIDDATTARLEEKARQARVRARIRRTNRRKPLPDQHADGRWSIPGAARRFGVSDEVVRRWLKRGLVAGSREDHNDHRNVWWLDVDDATARVLQQDAEKARARKTLSEAIQ